MSGSLRPKVFSEVDVRALCKLLEFHTKLSKPFLYGYCFVLSNNHFTRITLWYK